MAYGERKNLKIFDPFHGSGTALYEAADIDPSVFVYGYDIITCVINNSCEVTSIDEESFEQDYAQLEKILQEKKTTQFSHFTNLRNGLNPMF
jgi:tRNA G10  N-methylase Trm11